MSQYDYGIIDPGATSGTQLLDHLGLARDAVNSMHKGAARPSYAKAGMLWVKTATKPLLMYYDGSSDTTLGEIDLAAGVIKVGNSTKFNGRSEADFLLKTGNLSGLTDTAAARSALGLVIGTAVQAFSSVLAATTASFTTALKSKLDNIEASADVTDATNVATAGALMTSAKATYTHWRNNTANKYLVTDQVWSAAGTVPLSDGASIALDLSTGFNFTVALGGNRTLANPTNVKSGQAGFIRVTQDLTGARTLSFGSSYKFAGGSAPTLTTSANATDLLFYQALSATEIIVSNVLDIS
jgi:hypothetical protein